MKKIIILICMLVLFSITVNAEIFNFTYGDCEDGSIRQDVPTTPLGGIANNIVRNTGTNLAIAYFLFHTSENLTDGMLINSVEFCVYQYYSEGGTNLGVYEVNTTAETWDNATLIYDNAPCDQYTINPEKCGTSVMDSDTAGVGWHCYDVTEAGVNAMAKTPVQQNISFMWWQTNLVNQDQQTASCEYATVNQRPYLTVDAEPLDSGSPKLNASNNNSGLKINEVINLTANVSDDTSLKGCSFIENSSGTPTYVGGESLTGTSGQCSFAITNTLARDNVINFSVMVNDTADNINQTDFIITIANTNPTQANIINTSGLRQDHNITINITPSTDSDSDTLTYYWYRNTTASPTPTLLQSGTTQTSWTTILTDGTYYYFVNVSDSVLNVSGVIWSFTLDSIPSVPVDNVTNNSYYNYNVTFEKTVTDTDIYNLTTNLTNGSYTFEFHINDSPDWGELKILRTYNLTGLTSGNYSLIYESVQSHSDPIDDTILKKGKKGETELVFNDTGLEKQINLLVSFVEKSDKPTDTPGTLKTYIETTEEGYYGFGLNVTVLKPQTKILFTLNTDLNNLKYLTNTRYKGHFMLLPYGLDFEGILLVNGIKKEYNVIVTDVTKSSATIKIEPVELLAGNDVVEFRSETLFGINLQTVTYNLIVDNTNPSFSSIGQSPLNITEATEQVNLTINITDVNLNSSSVKLWWQLNHTGTESFSCWDCVNKTQYKSDWHNTNDSTLSLEWVKTFSNQGGGIWQFNFSSVFDDVFRVTTSQLGGINYRNISGVIIDEGWQEVYSDNIILINVTNLHISDDHQIDYRFMMEVRNKSSTKIGDILETYICNSSFVPSDITTSTNCHLDGIITINDVADSFGFFEKSIETNLSGYIGDMKMTENITLAFKSTSPNSPRGWQMRWVSDGTTDSQARTSSNDGVTVTPYNNNRYFVLEVHSFDSNINFRYEVESSDYANNKVNSTLVSESEEIVNDPPTECLINNPSVGDNISNSLTITWIDSVDIHDFYYNISAYYPDTNTFNQTLGLVNKGTESIIFDTTSLDDENYILSCQAIENVTDGSAPSNLSSSQIFMNGNFTIDNTAPVVSLVNPANSSNWTTSNTVVLTYNVTDNKFISSCYYNVTSSTGQNKSGTDTTITTNINQTFSTTFTNAVYSWYVNCSDYASNTFKTPLWNFTVNYTATTPPVTPPSGGGGGSIDDSCKTVNSSCSSTACCSGLMCINEVCILMEDSEDFFLGDVFEDLTDYITGLNLSFLPQGQDEATQLKVTRIITGIGIGIIIAIVVAILIVIALVLIYVRKRK